MLLQSETKTEPDLRLGRLLLNDDKSKFLVIRTRQQLNKLGGVGHLSLQVGDHNIDPSLNARNLGAIIDNSLSMNNHIKQICKSCFYHIHNIRRISKFLSKECLQTLVHAFVTWRLDYCNSLLSGLPKYQIFKLQRVQNTAKRLISNARKYDLISSVFSNLHWLPVFYRTHYKILIIIFKAIHGMSPSYISDFVSIRTCSSYLLRSHHSIVFEHPNGRVLATLGARSFCDAALVHCGTAFLLISVISDHCTLLRDKSKDIFLH